MDERYTLKEIVIAINRERGMEGLIDIAHTLEDVEEAKLESGEEDIGIAHNVVDGWSEHGRGLVDYEAPLLVRSGTVYKIMWVSDVRELRFKYAVALHCYRKLRVTEEQAMFIWHMMNGKMESMG